MINKYWSRVERMGVGGYKMVKKYSWDRNTVLSVDYAEANNGGGANDDAKSMKGLWGGLGAQRSGGFIVDSLTDEEVTVEVDVGVDRGGTGGLAAS